MSAEIAAAGLTKRFGRTVAVDGLDLAVARGRIFGFLGPNGAGKTTTIRMLAGVIAPNVGSASILGLELTRDRAAIKRRIGYVSQQSKQRTLFGKDLAEADAFDELTTARLLQGRER